MIYTLIDGPERQLEAPYTFPLPHPALIDALAVGDHVKLGFEYDPPGEEYGGERMWVLIDDIDDDRFRGSIDNDPFEKILSCGDKVEFQRKNILDILLAEGNAEPPVPAARTYWERCLVDECILYEDVPVEYIYREEPEEQQGHEYPDSGWRIRGRQGKSSDDEMDKREVAFVSLGAVLNKDDSWIDLIESTIGSAFMRNFDSNRYESVR